MLIGLHIDIKLEEKKRKKKFTEVCMWPVIQTYVKGST